MNPRLTSMWPNLDPDTRRRVLAVVQQELRQLQLEKNDDLPVRSPERVKQEMHLAVGLAKRRRRASSAHPAVTRMEAEKLLATLPKTPVSLALTRQMALLAEADAKLNSRGAA
jgi:hypothetical protein